MKALRTAIAAAIGIAMTVGVANLYAQSGGKTPAPAQPTVQAQPASCPCCGVTLTPEMIQQIEARRAERAQFRAERQKLRESRPGRGGGARFQAAPFGRRGFNAAPGAPQGGQAQWFRGGRAGGNPPAMGMPGGRPGFGRGRGWMTPPPVGQTPPAPEAPAAPNADAQPQTDKQ